jgi:site-specific DNA recombinase
VRRALAAQIADASATTAKLTDEVVRLEGRARELVEAKLRAEAARLDDAERRLRALEDDALDLELVESQREWFASALRNFGMVWGEMTPENQGRLLRALVAKVSVDEKTGMCRVELVNFDAVTSAKEAA